MDPVLIVLVLLAAAAWASVIFWVVRSNLTKRNGGGNHAG
jgi:hypothetical protein